MRRFFLLGLFLLGGGLFLAQQIYAQGIGVGVTPLVFEISGNPGEVIENQFKVYNPSDNIVGIKMTVEDIAPSPDDTGYVTVEPPETETYSIARWTKPEPEEFLLNPKEERWIKFIISIPENAEPGGHYGTIIAGASVVQGLEATGAAMAPRVGVLVLVTVPGQMKENLLIKNFTAPQYSEYGPINFVIRFENKGTVHVKPRGLITITNWLGKKVTDISFPEKNVLPNAVRKFEATFNQKWLFGGKYTATLTGSYGISNTSLTPSVITFWVFPWKVGVIILIVLIFFILTRRRWLGALKVLIKGEKAIR